MDLTEARGPERLLVERLEQLADAAVQLFLDRALDVLEVDLADVVLKLGELPDIRRGQQVGPCREHLAELDVGWAELDEALPERDRAVVGALFGDDILLDFGQRMEAL